VSDKERQLALDSLFKDVASVLSEKCINPDNNKPYTISMLERALKDVHFSVDLHRNAKQQALEVSFSWLMHAADTLLVCLLAQLQPLPSALPPLILSAYVPCCCWLWSRAACCRHCQCCKQSLPSRGRSCGYKSKCPSHARLKLWICWRSSKLMWNLGISPPLR